MTRWRLSYDDYVPEAEGLREALCTLGNGYFATRAAAPESQADEVHNPGTYLAGCYDRQESHIADRTIDNDDLVNIPNWLPLTFRVEGGAWLSLDELQAEGRLHSYRQELDMRRGVLTRLFSFADPDGRISRVSQRRIVSMDDPHLAALETTLVAENWHGRLEVRSALDCRVANTGVARYRDLNGRHLVPEVAQKGGPETIWLRCRTASSGVTIAVAARTRTTSPAKRTTLAEPGWVAHDLLIDVSEGEPVTVEKVVSVFSSRDQGIEECSQAARTRIERADDFDRLLGRQTLAWDRLWHRCQIGVDHDDVQRVLNLHIFHLLQTVSEHTVGLDAGVPARGLHGEAYRGHVFWDELFILPFLAMRFPEIARALLLYRWRRLPEARWAARQAGHRGAMFPWQSAGDGREETQRVHLNPRSGRWLPDNSHLQRHVGLAIAYNVWRFYEATGDLEFLAEYGAEMLLEIALYFADITTYDRTLDAYEIRGVMGPDEYHDGYPDRAEPGLDNNAYTNVMTVWVMQRALEVLSLLPADRSAELREHLEVGREEVTRFEDVSRKMRVPFHDGVICQFEGYEHLDELDWEGYRRGYGDIRRLDRILEAEGDTANRYKASKQADVLMLFYLLTAEELTNVLGPLGHPCEPDFMRRTIDYYMARTSHGSTLSELVHAWLLARTDGEDSWRLFLDTLHSDLDDTQHGTTAEGIHLGAMAGTVDLVQRCYAGVSTRADTLLINPRLPVGIDEVRLGLRYRGHWGIDISCRRDNLRITLRSGVAEPIDAARDRQVRGVRLGPATTTPPRTPSPAW
ncbi:glycosyl hydrolase family 65 protein [Spirillospora sp. NPDC047279]|uniref:glycoside hydrolase family 65 protein n=1 Tax=Spirillospora sp. NPDC047279 TaxID=3155478 RepID=UPI0033D9C56D